MSDEETRKIDVTPTVYGEAYAYATGMVNSPDFNERVNEEDKNYVLNKVTQNATDRMVRFVMFRRVLQELVENEEYDVSQEDIDQIHKEILEEENDQRTEKALEEEN